MQVEERVGVRSAIKDELEHFWRLEELLQSALVKRWLPERLDVDEDDRAARRVRELRQGHLAVATQVHTLKVDRNRARTSQALAVLAACSQRVHEDRRWAGASRGGDSALTPMMRRAASK